MKKINLLALGFLVTFGFSACIKDGETFDPAAQYELEKPQIEAYAIANGLLQHHDIGGMRVYYELVTEGDPTSYQYKTTTNANGQLDIEAPDIQVIFSGRLLTGDDPVHKNQKDEGDETSLANRNIPPAWVYAFLPREIRLDKDGNPLNEPIKFGGVGGLTADGLKTGSKIRFVSPSLLLFGNTSTSQIPANSPMYYEIEVVNIEAPDSN
ncbi:hypothetical protein ACFOET_14815 [Parapedobacter deserti]|uniref:peptidylprolyl isomerase n=1 Tax=Parapedobacter deserti TaxID=1912957 RepID=A0ABV7JP77_9SPHI